MDVSKQVNRTFPGQQTHYEPDAEQVMKACALYALNDMLYRDGKISEARKQAVDFEIWKQYRF